LAGARAGFQTTLVAGNLLFRAHAHTGLHAAYHALDEKLSPLFSTRTVFWRIDNNTFANEAAPTCSLSAAAQI
jgi:hypothetical protein